MKKIYTFAVLLTLSFLLSTNAQASCTPTETSGDDTISCTGTNASVLILGSNGTDVFTFATSSTYQALDMVLDAGFSGTKTIYNYGSFLATSTTPNDIIYGNYLYFSTDVNSQISFFNYKTITLTDIGASSGLSFVTSKSIGSPIDVFQNVGTTTVTAISNPGITAGVTIYGNTKIVNSGYLYGESLIGLITAVSGFSNASTTLVNNGTIMASSSVSLFSAGNMGGVNEIINNGSLMANKNTVLLFSNNGSASTTTYFTNNGTASSSRGLVFSSKGTNYVTNNGTLTGSDPTYGAVYATTNINAKSSEVITNNLTGTINGKITLGTGSDILTNLGTINGSITGTGTSGDAKLIINKGGTLNGGIDLSASASTNAIVISLESGTTTGQIACGSGMDLLYVEATSTLLRTFSTNKITGSGCDYTVLFGGGDVMLSSSTVPGGLVVTGDALVVATTTTTVQGGLSLSASTLYDGTEDQYSGNVKFYISSASATSSNRLIVNGTADLGGRLIVATSTAGSFTLGQTIRLMDFVDEENVFNSNSLPTLSGGLGFDVMYYSDHVSLVVASSAVSYTLDDNRGTINIGKFTTNTATATTYLAEGSTTAAHFNLYLNGTPSAPVTVSCVPDSQVSIASTTIVLVGADPSMFADILAVNDSTYEDNHVGTVTCSAVSSDAYYNGQRLTITVNITDNDTAPVSSGSTPGGGGGGGGGGSAAVVANPIATSTAVTSTSPVALNTNTNVKYLFTKDLVVYGKNADTIKLQQFLNSKGYIIAKTGSGSKGKETNYFGPATKAALIKFQIKNKIKPASGYFGKITRTLVNSGLGL